MIANFNMNVQIAGFSSTRTDSTATSNSHRLTCCDSCRNFNAVCLLSGYTTLAVASCARRLNSLPCTTTLAARASRDHLTENTLACSTYLTASTTIRACCHRCSGSRTSGTAIITTNSRTNSHGRGTTKYSLRELNFQLSF